ncbi:MAG: carboxypeptidase regulatory-like domain-containing protein [Acidobacteriota bacterium]
MNARISTIIIVGLVLCLTVPGLLLCQTEKGAITGRVTDEQGGMVPGASVTVTSVSTNVSTTYQTSDVGTYEAPFLTPGLYKVTVTMPGFATSVSENIEVHVGDRVGVDFRLKVGEVKDTITVSGATESLMQTETASIGQLVDNKTIVTLPNADRNIYALLSLNSSVGQPPGGNGPAFRLETGGQFAVAGSRPSSMTFKIDGLSNTDPAFGTPTITPSLDAVREFKLQSHAYSAEYEGITQVNVATKSGGNEFHGSLFDFNRNDVFQPRNPNMPKDKTGKPGKNKLRFNQFGATIGGPVRLPWLYNGTDRTFFFFSYEGRRDNPLGYGYTHVPTELERRGDFSKSMGTTCARYGSPAQDIPLLNPDGTPSGKCVMVGQIFDPATQVLNPKYDPAGPKGSPLNPQYIRQPFPNNVIPTGRLNDIALRLFDAQLPMPNHTDPELNYGGAAGTRFVYDQYAARIDHTISEKDLIYGRFQIQNNNRTPKGLIPYQSIDLKTWGRVFSTTWNHVFGPTLVNEFRVGYVRGIYGNDLTEKIDPKQFGIQNTGLQTLPRLNLTPGAGAGLNYGGYSASILAEVQNTYQLADNVSLQRGAHSWKFGFKGDHNRFQAGERGGQNGTANFTGVYSVANDYAMASGTRPNALADFLLGRPVSTSLSIPGPVNVRNTPWSFYVQDDWQVAPRITINLGMRYEFHHPFRDQLKGGAVFDPSNGGRVLVAKKSVADSANTVLVACCADEHLVPADKTDFGPRVGLAIQPFENDSLVIRAGAGVFYSDQTQWFTWVNGYAPIDNPVFQNVIGDFYHVGPSMDNLFPTSAFIASTYRPTKPSNVPPQFLHPDGYVGGGWLGANGIGSQRTPYTQQWSLSIQRLMFSDMLVEVMYTGSNSKNLPTQWIFNQPSASPYTQNVQSPDPQLNYFLRRPFPNLSPSAYVLANILQSNYNAMTAKVNKTFSQGYSILSTYTWSKSIDQGSEVYAIGNTFNILSDSRNINRDRGVSSFDIPHRWVTSGIADLPFGKNKRFLNSSGWMDKLFGGFQFSGQFVLQSGQPFTPLVRNRLSNTGYALATERGDLVGDPYWSEEEWKQQIARWEAGQRLYLIDPASISLNYAPGTFGNIARNFFRAPYGRHLNLSVLKSTAIGEQARLEMRLEMHNVTRERLHRTDINAHAYANNLLTHPLVASIAPRYAFFNPHTIQLGLKLVF